MYFLIKPLLFQFDPENVHHFVTANLKRFNRFPGGAVLSRSLWDFENPKLGREGGEPSSHTAVINTST